MDTVAIVVGVATVVPHGCKLQYMRDCDPLTGNRIPHKPYIMVYNACVGLVGNVWVFVCQFINTNTHTHNRYMCVCYLHKLTQCVLNEHSLTYEFCERRILERVAS